MKRAAPPVSRPETWVFIDGDGNAWMHDGRAAEDPTPTDAVALELLALTPSPAIYLARACTFGTAAVDALCEPAVWTIDRYGESAVASMADALDVLGLSSSPLVIVGYSGGGVIATALANRLRNTVGLLTIAANLDVPRWVEYHGYAAELARRSLPAQLPLAAHIVQLHVYGLDDRNVPYELAANEIARDPNATTVVLSGADHDCCWSDLWPQIRQQFQQLMDASELTRATSSSR